MWKLSKQSYQNKILIPSKIEQYNALFGFYHGHRRYYHSFFPVTTIVIPYNYIKLNNDCGFLKILNIWGLQNDCMQKLFFS